MPKDISVVDLTDGHGAFYVYVYRDASGSDPVYVGKGTEDKRGPCSRALFHWRHASRNKFFQAHLRSLRKAGLAPVIEIVGRFHSEEQAFDCEVSTIAGFGRRDLGLGSLLNLSDGGEGPVGFRHTREAREKIGVASKAMHSDPILSANRAAKISAALSKPEVKAVRSQIMKEVHARPGDKDRRAAAQRLTFSTKEHKKRRSEATKESFRRAETRAAHSSALRKHWAKDGAKADQSAAMKALHADPDHKRRHTEAVRAWFASPEFAAKSAARRQRKLEVQPAALRAQ
ncbi:MAG: hypothetical protein V4477_16790 [Pseudomonadota bacterium]